MRKYIQKITGKSDITPARQYPLYRSLNVDLTYAESFDAGRLVFALPPVAKGAGGMADVMHLARAVQEGEAFDVAFLAPPDQPYAECLENLKWIDSEMHDAQLLRELTSAPEFLCATASHTAFQVATLPSAHKMYFVQDYEPWFFSAGIERQFAEQSYRLPFEMVTLGPWLSQYLAQQVPGCRVSPMPFPMTDEPAAKATSSPRKSIAMYLQPNKKHRGNELLIEAARVLVETAPDVMKDHEIVFFGSQINPYISFEFPCRVLGVLDEATLDHLMLEAAVGVCASFTNIALVPFRFVARGAPVVEMDLPNVTENIPESARSCFRFARPDAEAVAASIIEVLQGPPPTQSVLQGAAALYGTNRWNQCASEFMARMTELRIRKH